MSHHYSGPDFGFPHGDARLDFTDLFAFPKPGDASKSILIMNVHPSVGVNPPGPTTDVAFSPEAIYELRIDTNGDQVADIAYRVRFTSAADGTQTATFRRAEGAQAAGIGDEGQVIVEGVPVSTGTETQVVEAGNYRFFAGWRGDPFFFDVQGALNNLQFTGDDYFADKDIASIVMEVPNSALGKGTMGVGSHTGRHHREMGSGRSWCAIKSNSFPRRRTERRLSCCGASGRRALRPRFRARAGTRRWIYASGSNARRRDAAAGHPSLYPTGPAVYPKNGRTLTDDVVDFFLSSAFKWKGDAR